MRGRTKLERMNQMAKLHFHIFIDGCELVEIRVAADDAGKVIGRQGRVIKSIRVLARAAACGNGNAVEVELVEG